MSYAIHNFASGMKLSGAAMAEVDEQIRQNEEDIRALEDSVAAVPGQRAAQIRQLRLTTDADAIFLYYGEELLSSVSVPGIEGVIPCTELTATGDLRSLLIGTTAQITAQRQPSDCNQSIRFLSSDRSIATVTSAGVVTAVGVGSATITVSCGTHSVTIPVTTAKIVDLSGKVDYTSWIQMGDWGSVPCFQFVTTPNSSNNFAGNCIFDFESFRIPAGFTATLSFTDSNLTTRWVHICKANPDIEKRVQDIREDNDRVNVYGVQAVSSSTSAQESYTYTNETGEDNWIFFTYRSLTQSTEEWANAEAANPHAVLKISA